MRSSSQKSIVVGGFTGSGKSTLSLALGKRAGLPVVSASSRLIKEMGDATPRKTRLLEWLSKEQHVRRTVEHDRTTDMQLLTTIEGEEAFVIDSGYVGVLLSPTWTGLRVWVEAPRDVRSMRIHHYLACSDVSVTDCRTILERKDAATVSAARNAWGIDLAARPATHFRHDLVLRCPHLRDECYGEGCASAMADLAYAFWNATRGVSTSNPSLPDLELWNSLRHPLARYILRAQHDGSPL